MDSSGTAPRPRRWERGEQSVRLDLEERLGIRQAGQTMPAEAAEAETGRHRCSDGFRGLAGHDDLTPMGRGADTGYGVDGQTDVAEIGEGGATAVDPDANPHFEIVAPGPCAERPLDGRCRLDGVDGALDDGEELVGADVDRAAACAKDRRTQCASDAAEQVSISIAQAAEKSGGAFDIGHQERHEPLGERGSMGGLSPRRLQLAGNETDGDNAVLFRCVQQPLAGALARSIVLKVDLVEPGKRIPHVSFVIDGQSPPAAGVDVGEGVLRKAGPLAGVKPGHDPTLTFCSGRVYAGGGSSSVQAGVWILPVRSMCRQTPALKRKARTAASRPMYTISHSVATT